MDELHQYKSVDSDQGYAMHQLAQAAEKVVALTGTIYGGKASSLFHLLFRLAPEMRRAYVEPEATGQRRLRSREWVSAYGILQRIETVTLDEDGRQTANSRSNVRFKELPGGSPAMLPFAIPGLANLWLIATKDTALLAIVGFNELTQETRTAAGQTKAYFTFFVAAGVLYLLLTLVSDQVIARIERWSRRGMPSVSGSAR